MERLRGLFFALVFAFVSAVEALSSLPRHPLMVNPTMPRATKTPTTKDAFFFMIEVVFMILFAQVSVA